MNISQPLLLEGPDCTCLFSPVEREKLRFRHGGNDLLSISGIGFGKFDESSAYCAKSKKHESIDGLNTSLETVNIMPFGSEPSITRKCEMAGNHVVITTDFDLRSRIEVGSLEIDNLIIKGTWAKIGIMKISSPVPGLADMQWHDVSGRENFRIELTQIPLLLVLENCDGFKIEIGSGDDLWRWTNISVFPEARQSMVLEKADDGISLIRKVACWDLDTAIIPRKYRFSWYFAWEKPGRKYLKRLQNDDAKDMEYFRFPEGDVPQQLAAFHEGRNLGVSCYHSPSVSGIFRDLIRSFAGSAKGGDIVLANLSVPLCENAAHLERPQKQQLLHWNMTRLFTHWLWANKQLKNSGSRFFAITEDKESIFSILPSVRGLSEIRE